MQTQNQLLIDVTAKLTAASKTIAVAESCTGGLLAAALTQLPGSSTWFECGFVTYSYAAKQAILGVLPQLLIDHGAVSEVVAKAMVKGVLDESAADMALAITGIAGPDTDAWKTPIGTVWFALMQRGCDSTAYVQTFSGDRHFIREQAVEFALHLMSENV